MNQRAAVLEMRGDLQAIPACGRTRRCRLFALGRRSARTARRERRRQIGVDEDSQSEILINGREANIQSPREALARGVRIIYQELNLISHLSVAENIYRGAAPTRLPGLIDWRQLFQNTSVLLRDLGLEIDPATPLHRSSLAQRQRVEIAKALKDDTLVLVLDEPTPALTSREVDQLFALIARLIARGVAIISSHTAWTRCIASANASPSCAKLSDALIRTEAGSAGHPGSEAVEHAATIMARQLGWDEWKVRNEVAEVEAFYRLPV